MKTLSLSSSSLRSSDLQNVKYAFNTDIDQLLKYAIPRLDQLNHFRIEKALSANSVQFNTVFSLIPLLIHLNHPALPAYVSHAPCGIAHFEFSDFQRNYLSEKGISGQNLTIPCKTPKFDGLYAMGSTGSITQTILSDLDLWLCYSDQLSVSDYPLIEEKIIKIKQWAKEFGIDINIYLMNPTHFKAQTSQNDINEEHSGSAQHFFLLDEFYRSAIRLAGKRLLWLHLIGQTYRKCVALQAANPDYWIDFGDFSSLSTAEFFGASLWQLYKGINSPYKSTIKILLLENYAQTYPKTALISKTFKKLLLTRSNINYHFDPYLAMLDRVTEYLLSRQEFNRLDCVRMCFYLKANEGERISSWRTDMLDDLIKSWHWSDKEIQLLNNRHQWKIKQTENHQKIIVEQLLLSYRNLLKFARKLQLDPCILTHDVDTLMRQLYSVFEVLPDKVSLITPYIWQDLSENAVTFVEVQQRDRKSVV